MGEPPPETKKIQKEDLLEFTTLKNYDLYPKIRGWDFALSVFTISLL